MSFICTLQSDSSVHSIYNIIALVSSTHVCSGDNLEGTQGIFGVKVGQSGATAHVVCFCSSLTEPAGTRLLLIHCSYIYMQIMCGDTRVQFLEHVIILLLYKYVIKRLHRNQKYVGMAVVNKVHIQVWTPLQLAPYIVTHNHSYISSCKPELLRYLLHQIS